jgi:hypothetical protein
MNYDHQWDDQDYLDSFFFLPPYGFARFFLQAFDLALKIYAKKPCTYRATWARASSLLTDLLYFFLSSFFFFFLLDFSFFVFPILCF